MKDSTNHKINQVSEKTLVAACLINHQLENIHVASVRAIYKINYTSKQIQFKLSSGIR